MNVQGRKLGLRESCAPANWRIFSVSMRQPGGVGSPCSRERCQLIAASAALVEEIRKAVQNESCQTGEIFPINWDYDQSKLPIKIAFRIGRDDIGRCGYPRGYPHVYESDRGHKFG